MTWTKISDDFLDRPDLLVVSRSARLLLIELTVYANRHGLDGRIPIAALGKITDAVSGTADLAELEDAGVCENDGAHILVDWSDQITAEESQRLQDEGRLRKERSRRHRSGDHSLCRPSYCRLASVDSSPDASVTRDTTSDGQRPVPTRPDPARQGRGREGELEVAAASGPGGPAAPLEGEVGYRTPCVGCQAETRTTVSGECVVCGKPKGADLVAVKVS